MKTKLNLDELISVLPEENTFSVASETRALNIDESLRLQDYATGFNACLEEVKKKIHDYVYEEELAIKLKESLEAYSDECTD